MLFTIRTSAATAPDAEQTVDLPAAVPTVQSVDPTQATVPPAPWVEGASSSSGERTLAAVAADPDQTMPPPPAAPPDDATVQVDDPDATLVAPSDGGQPGRPR